MDALRECRLDQVAIAAANDQRPFLGVCVGMQMLYEGSEESPSSVGLGVLPGRLRLLPDTVKRPQMQWNLVDVRRPSRLFADVSDPVWMYFVHSYAADAEGESVVATCEYGGLVAAAVERDGLWATQFHPEKSGAVGLELLRGFVDAARPKVGN
jgi:glutamine amidotransferase